VRDGCRNALLRGGTPKGLQLTLPANGDFCCARLLLLYGKSLGTIQFSLSLPDAFTLAGCQYNF